MDIHTTITYAAAKANRSLSHIHTHCETLVPIFLSHSLSILCHAHSVARQMLGKIWCITYKRVASHPASEREPASKWACQLLIVQLNDPTSKPWKDDSKLFVRSSLHILFTEKEIFVSFLNSSIPVLHSSVFILKWTLSTVFPILLLNCRVLKFYFRIKRIYMGIIKKKIHHPKDGPSAIIHVMSTKKCLKWKNILIPMIDFDIFIKQNRFICCFHRSEFPYTSFSALAH